MDNDRVSFAMGEVVCLEFLAINMEHSFATVTKTLPLIFSLLEKVDVELYEFLSQSGVQSFFALSWVLTWFSHDIRNVQKIARVFDVMLCSHPLFSLYLSAAVS